MTRLRRRAAAAILARALAAILGGYALAALATVAATHALPLPAAEAVLAGTLASFALWVAAAIWAFAAGTALRAWLGLALPAIALAALAWATGGAPP